MGRMGQLLSILFIVLVVALAVGALFYFRKSSSKDQAEEPEARVTVEPATPGGTTVPTGGGGEVQGGWYQLYFTAPQYPDTGQNHRGGLDEKLVALIDRAHKSVDVADYDFDLANVAVAMVRAKNRGARVRMVTDSDTIARYATLRAGLPALVWVSMSWIRVRSTRSADQLANPKILVR